MPSKEPLHAIDISTVILEGSFSEDTLYNYSHYWTPLRLSERMDAGESWSVYDQKVNHQFADLMGDRYDELSVYPTEASQQAQCFYYTVLS